MENSKVILIYSLEISLLFRDSLKQNHIGFNIPKYGGISFDSTIYGT